MPIAAIPGRGQIDADVNAIIHSTPPDAGGGAAGRRASDEGNEDGQDFHGGSFFGLFFFVGDLE